MHEELNLISIWIFRIILPLTLIFLIIFLYLFYQRICLLRMERDELVQQKNIVFGFIHDMGELFTDSLDINIQALLDKALFYATRTCKARSGAIYLLDERSGRMEAHALAGIFPPLHTEQPVNVGGMSSRSRDIEELVRTHSFATGEGIVGETATRGNGLLIQDAELDDRVPNHQTDFLKIRSLVAVPMRFGRKTVGVAVLTNRVDGLPFTPADVELLQSLADQSAVPLHYAGLSRQLEQKQQLDHDMDVANQIQTLLLPHELPQLDNFELSAFSHPAQAIGGDYYDYIQIDQTHLGIAIADVSGKGIGGAMVMAVCRSVLRSRASQFLSPSAALRELNRMVAPDLADDMFVSMLYMILDLETRELVLARAGHERPILCRDGKNRLLDGPGMVVGIGEPDLFDSVIKDVHVRLEPGDIVVAYTDGITEAMNDADEEWGLPALEQQVAGSARSGAETVIRAIRRRLMDHVGDRAQYDDMTLLAFRVR